MDFSDTPEEAVFRKEVRSWLAANGSDLQSTAPDDLYDSLKAHFSERPIVDLTLIISLMNAWNRLSVGFRHLPDARG